jgi:TrmH family RNA methyltransferase
MAHADEVIRSRRNPLVRRLRDLRDSARAGETCFLEGPRLVLEAVSAGLPLLEAAAAPRAERTPAGQEALRALARAGIVPRSVHEDVLASLSEADSSQGLLAIARRPCFDEDLLFQGTPLVIVALGVQNPGNLGGLLRTAEAAGGTGAILAGPSADPLSWKALRGAMGSAFRLPHLREKSVFAALDRLEARGVRLAAAVAHEGTPYDQADLRGPLALILGNEAAGLAPDVLARAALRLHIPLRPPVESLNVSVAAGVLLFEAARQRRGVAP